MTKTDRLTYLSSSSVGKRCECVLPLVENLALSPEVSEPFQAQQQ